MMQALSGYDPLDPGSADVAVPDFVGAIGTGVKGLRIGVPRSFFEKEIDTDPETVAALESALKVFASLGAIVSDVTLPPIADYNNAGSLIMGPEAFAIHERYLTKTPELYGELARRRIMSGAFVRASDHVNALRQRAKLVALTNEIMKTVDILITPTRSGPSVEIGTFDNSRAPSYTRMYNVLGYPALSICSGFSAAGLPLGLQIAARPFEDDLALKLGDAFEKATEFRRRRPHFAPLERVAA